MTVQKLLMIIWYKKSAVYWGVGRLITVKEAILVIENFENCFRELSQSCWMILKLYKDKKSWWLLLC